MQEKDFQTELNKWIQYNVKETMAFEVKLCKTNRLPASAFKSHQLPSLCAANSGEQGLTYKIPDDTRGFKPFDAFHLHNAKAVAAIQFYRRGTREFIIIDAQKLSKWFSVHRSITEDEAKTLGHVFELGRVYTPEHIRGIGLFDESSSDNPQTASLIS